MVVASFKAKNLDKESNNNYLNNTNAANKGYLLRKLIKN